VVDATNESASTHHTTTLHDQSNAQVSGYSAQNAYIRSPPETTRVNAAQIQQSVDSSLKRLGVDHVDLLQIHVGLGWLVGVVGLS